MSLDIWLSFVFATSILCFTPGPTVLLIVGQSFLYGKKSSLPLVLGVLSGDVVALSLSLVGVSTILMVSGALFAALKWCGAAYLIYIGLKALLAKTNSDRKGDHLLGSKHVDKIKWRAFRQAFAVTALNPKGIVFFMAFFPLFIDHQDALTGQLVILSITFMCVSALSATTYALSASHIVKRFNSPKLTLRFNRISGAMLVSAGLITASIKSES